MLFVDCLVSQLPSSIFLLKDNFYNIRFFIFGILLFLLEPFCMICAPLFSNSGIIKYI